jgi:hypothetical protein
LLERKGVGLETKSRQDAHPEVAFLKESIVGLLLLSQDFVRQDSTSSTRGRIPTFFLYTVTMGTIQRVYSALVSFISSALDPPHGSSIVQ